MPSPTARCCSWARRAPPSTSAVPGWGSERPALRRLNLRPLSVRASQELVLEILQKADEVPDALRDLVVATAEGIPFFAEELIKMLLDDGVIQPQADGAGPWHVAADRLTEFRVPPSLTGVLQARLDRLEPAERIVVQQASVVGRRFWDRAVARLGEISGGADRRSRDRCNAGHAAAKGARVRARRVDLRRLPGVPVQARAPAGCRVREPPPAAAPQLPRCRRGLAGRDGRRPRRRDRRARRVAP